ncbi:MAG: hypothetical protein U9P72_12170 [Campylobacterota bacterium]|nr:hypothetical protein [Campylobacterota bacterium]
MKTIDEKLMELNNNTKKDFQETIQDLEMFLSDTNPKNYINFASLNYVNKSEEEIKEIYTKTKKDYEYFIKNTINDIYGWDYMEDVNYLDNKENKDFKNLMNSKYEKYNLKEYPKEAIFKHLNKLKYFDSYIYKLGISQEKHNISRIRKKQPIKEIITVLRFINDDDQIVTPLIKLLHSMDGDSSNELNLKHRDIYHSFGIKALLNKRPLNIDKKQELKNLYNEESNNLLFTIRKHKNKYVKLIQEEILNLLK